MRFTLTYLGLVCAAGVNLQGSVGAGSSYAAEGRGGESSLLEAASSLKEAVLAHFQEAGPRTPTFSCTDCNSQLVANGLIDQDSSFGQSDFTPCTFNPETIGTADDACCTSYYLPIANPSKLNKPDRAYWNLCLAGTQQDDPCWGPGALCYDEAEPDFLLQCVNGGRCDVRRSYQVVSTGTQGKTGAIVDSNPSCASVMMSDDGHECRYRPFCSYTSLGQESPCGYWCGQWVTASTCQNQIPSGVGLPGTTQWIEGGGCIWDEDSSNPGVCERVEFTAGPLRTVTTTGCTAVQDVNAANGQWDNPPCIDTFTNGQYTGSELQLADGSTVPTSRCTSCNANQVCGSNTPNVKRRAKCRQMITEWDSRVSVEQDTLDPGTTCNTLKNSVIQNFVDPIKFGALLTNDNFGRCVDLLKRQTGKAKRCKTNLDCPASWPICGAPGFCSRQFQSVAYTDGAKVGTFAAVSLVGTTCKALAGILDTASLATNLGCYVRQEGNNPRAGADGIKWNQDYFVRDVFLTENSVINSGLMLKFPGNANSQELGIPDFCEPGEVLGETAMIYETTIDRWGARQTQCSSLSRTSSKCSWVNKGEAKGCISNPCSHLNSANSCTIQNSGGRCVWYEKRSSVKGGVPQIANARRPGHVGCFTSPCNTPVPNVAAKCHLNGGLAMMGGCKTTCAEAWLETVDMTKTEFFERYPSCTPTEDWFPCPCMTYANLHALGPLYSDFPNTNEVIDLEACEFMQSSNAQFNERYCPVYGPCFPKLFQYETVGDLERKRNPDRYPKLADVGLLFVDVYGNGILDGVPQLVDVTKYGLGKYYRENTFYDCEWNKESDTVGDGAIGCQNIEAISASRGNLVKCDKFRIVGDCPFNDPLAPTGLENCYSNPYCQFCADPANGDSDICRIYVNAN